MLNKKMIKDLFLYLIVGIIATLAEWLVFYLANDLGRWNYMVATVVAYILSTFVNWLAGRIIMFKESAKGILYDLLCVYGASIIGLVLNLLIMWVAVEVCRINEMIAKIAATGIVFIWNFLIRKFFIYKN